MSFNIKEVLATLNLEIIRERGDEILGHCPMHQRILGKEDANPSWWINQETGAHICFSCGFKGSVFSLVGHVKEFYEEEDVIDYEQVKEWLANIQEVTVEELGNRLKNMPDYVSLPKPIPMSEARLALFTAPPDWALHQKSISAEAAEKYEVLWDKDKWILVIRDPHTHELLGWQEKAHITKGFKNRPTGVKKSSTLFGVQHMDKKRVIVVESPLDVVRLETVGIKGAVATFGAIVSDAQLKLIRSSESVIAAFDNPNMDEAGRKASESLIVSARKYGIEVKFFNYNGRPAKDPGEMIAEDIHFGLDNAKDMIYGEEAYFVKSN